MLSGNASNDAVTVVGLSFPSIAATANHRRTGAREFYLDGPDETLTALGEGCKTNERYLRRAAHTVRHMPTHTSPQAYALESSKYTHY